MRRAVPEQTYTMLSSRSLVLGGISVRDEGWKITQSDFSEILTVYFGGTVPDSFELHAEELLSPTGDVPFTGHDRDRRNSLAKQVLQLLHHRSHDVHLFAIDKAKLSAHPPIEGLSFEPHVPFLLAYDYLITFIDWFVRECLGRSARGMIILDAKPEFLAGVHTVTHARRDDFVWHNEQHRRGKRTYYFHRWAFALWNGATGNEVRRNYANSRGYFTASDPTCTTYGQGSVDLGPYETDGDVFESNVGDNSTLNGGDTEDSSSTTGTRRTAAAFMMRPTRSTECSGS